MELQEVLEEYSNSLRTLRRQCLDSGMSDVEFKELYFESLKSLDTSNQENTSRTVKKRLPFLGVVFLLWVMYNYKIIYSCLMCNLQVYVYPGLRLLRRISVPLISLFPSLTELYHESCLVQNPFFTVVDMDCWPCSSISNVREVNDPRPVHQQHNAPFIYETEQKVINMESLKDLYLRYKDVFDAESPKILVNNKFYIGPQDIFLENTMKDEKSLYSWRLNNMIVARLLRQVIQRPKVVPMFGQSTERFLLIQSSQEAFHIPDTECNFSFLLALSGSRVVKLEPAEECKFQCKNLKVELQETYLLWYNWWYWRPMVQSSSENSTFIAHVGSYC